MTLGESVHWTSQAAGSTKTKQGVILAIVPAGKRPQEVLESLRGSSTLDYGFARTEVSYLVKVKGRGAPYWPRTSLLNPGPMQAAPDGR